MLLKFPLKATSGQQGSQTFSPDWNFRAEPVWTTCASSPQVSSRTLLTPRSAPYWLRLQPQPQWKMRSYSLRINSTIWFWKTMNMVMLADSASGLRSVGPKTMATFCTVIRLSSP